MDAAAMVNLVVGLAGLAAGTLGAWLKLRGTRAEIRRDERAAIVAEYQGLVESLSGELKRVKEELAGLRDEFTEFRGRRAWCDGCGNVDRCMAQYATNGPLGEPLPPRAGGESEARPAPRGPRRTLRASLAPQTP